MPDEVAAERFFSRLADLGHERLLEGTSGTLLVELSDGEAAVQRWYVRIHRGDVSVATEPSAPDCVLSTDVSTFEAIVAGRLNAFAAMLRGLLEVEGQIHLLVALQALFRPSAGAADQAPAGWAERGG